KGKHGWCRPRPATACRSGLACVHAIRHQKPEANGSSGMMQVLDEAARNRRAVRYWLYAVLMVLFALMLVGGATRLTGSGLSITEWKPIHGVIPPLSDADWQEEFDKYRQIPQYRELNRGMTLDEFKTIYWWEWVHRILARGVGFLVAL